MGLDDGDRPQRPSRAEVETLMILHIIMHGGCRAVDMVSRLGLSPSLGSAISTTIEPLIAQGLIIRQDEILVLSDAGKDMLTSRLSAFGLSRGAEN